MLEALHIENIALIKEIDIRFNEGFTVFTGETGAGKSIIIDSINLLLGDKPQKGLIRKGEESAYVSALFSGISEQKRQELSLAGIDIEGEEILIERVISEGKTSAKINGRTVTVSMLRECSGKLINIHGQHASQVLLNPKNHERLLDAYAEDAPYLENYRTLYGKINAIVNEIKALTRDEAEKKRTSELLKYQLKDIDSAKLKPGEEEELRKKRDAVRHIHKISKSVKAVYRSLYRNDKIPTACDRVSYAVEALEAVSEEMPETQAYIQRLQTCRYELEDVALSVRTFLNGMDENPDELLSQLEERIDTIIRLKRKYGADIGEILAYRDKIAGELQALENADTRIYELKKELKLLLKAAKEAADVLSQRRISAAEDLRERVLQELSYLDMGKVRFQVRVDSADGQLKPNGVDLVEFLIATNKGEELMPLEKIASGGELSRIMLALKSIFSDKDGIGTVIYDEIDTGISGATSEKIGIKLKSTAKNNQVIAVTHSAQIAANADNHLYIYKTEQEDRTFTCVQTLDYERRIGEVARIMGGINKSETVLLSAKEMIDRAAKV